MEHKILLEKKKERFRQIIVNQQRTQYFNSKRMQVKGKKVEIKQNKMRYKSSQQIMSGGTV